MFHIKHQIHNRSSKKENILINAEIISTVTFVKTWSSLLLLGKNVFKNKFIIFETFFEFYAWDTNKSANNCKKCINENEFKIEQRFVALFVRQFELLRFY